MKTKIHLFPTGRLGNQLYFGALALAVQSELNASGRKSEIIAHSEDELNQLNFLLGIKIDKIIRNRTYRRILGKKRLQDSNMFLRAIYKIYALWYRVSCQKLVRYEDISYAKIKIRVILSESNQDYRYFRSIKNQIGNHQINSGLSDLPGKYFSTGQLLNRIAVHMRFGDYLDTSIAAQYGNLDENYYSRALSALSHDVNFKSLDIQLFSDDLARGADLLKKIGIESVSTLEGFRLPPEEELFIMSNFSQIILSNSTFSWWAGYFASETSRVVAPNPLMRVVDRDLSRSPNWIYIDGWS